VYGSNTTPGTGLIVLTSTVIGGYQLPHTGSSITPLLLVGTALIALGLGLTTRARRMRSVQ
jgi:LPXTG-motif cell wall-anchored protein